MSSPSSQRVSLDRRQALKHMTLLASGLVAGCKLGDPPVFASINDGRLVARPTSQTSFPQSGAQPFLLEPGRDGRLYVPPGLTAGTPAPLILLLHGASGSGQSMLTSLQSWADQQGIVLVCPDSRGFTWDAIHYAYSDDVLFINSALQFAFDRCSIDPERIGIAGFSDGATYAIGLGRINGDLFKRMVAFSPGLLLPAMDTYKPPLYLTHGYRDDVLPMDLTSTPIAEELEARGYQVIFRKFDGGHWMPAAYVPEAFHWLVTGELTVAA